jgi:ribonuclease Y
MTPYIIYGLIIGIASFVIFFCVWYFVVLPSKRKRMTEEAEQEAEIIKQKKLLEVKEKFISKKAELENEVRQRNQQIQQAENRAKQRELSLNQRQDEGALRIGNVPAHIVYSLYELMMIV